MSTSMIRMAVIAAVALWLGVPTTALAQTPGKKLHIGILVGGSQSNRGHLEQALLQALREEGYIEGRNLVLERRYADGRTDRTPQLASELAAMKLDAVVSTCTPTTRAAQRVLGSTPIVMAAVADPVGQQLIASLARPGANVTGMSSQAEDILPKMLELFGAVLPRPVTVAVLSDARSAVHPRMWQSLQPVAQALRIRLVKVEAGLPPAETLPAAFEAARREKANAIFVLPDEPMFLSQRSRIVGLAAQYHLPAFYGAREFVDEGGLMSYGENLRAAYRNAAGYIARVAHCAKPAEMPVQQPTRFELVINRTTARSLGLTMPQSLLLGADEVIE
jgi:putative tryptophan/tyrosine transport system substrate-binding protein